MTLASDQSDAAAPITGAAGAGLTVSVVTSSTPPAPRIPLFRRLIPFVVAVLLLGFVASRINFDAFGRALAALDYVSFLAFNAGWCVALLAADALGNFAAYRLTMPGVRWKDFFVYRGASYLPSLVNHHLGQGYMTYLMAKLAAVPIARMAGATLVSYASWMGCLLGCVVVALPFSRLPVVYVPVILVAGALYLVVIALRPARLARVTLLSPLFEAGIGGHAIAFTARLPHLAVLVLGTWGSFFFFGIRIPLVEALVYLPMLLVATTLPITPQGFGTRDTAAQLFFEVYAPGATQEERFGVLAACTTSWGVASSIVAAIIGLVCGRIVSARLAALRERA